MTLNELWAKSRTKVALGVLVLLFGTLGFLFAVLWPYSALFVAIVVGIPALIEASAWAIETLSETLSGL